MVTVRSRKGVWPFHLNGATILKHTDLAALASPSLFRMTQIISVCFNMIAHIGLLGLPLLATAPQFPVNPHLWSGKDPHRPDLLGSVILGEGLCGLDLPHLRLFIKLLVGWLMGLEPTTTGITILGSTIELQPPLTILKHTYLGRTEILARLVFLDIEIILITVACLFRHIPTQLLRIRSWRYSPCFVWATSATRHLHSY